MEPIMFICGVIFLAVIFMMSCIITVKPKSGVLIHQFGGAVIREISNPGVYVKLPYPINTVGKRVSLSTESVTEKVKVKTRDEVFMTVEVNILCSPKKNALEKALYNLENPVETIKQITSEKVKSICVDMDVVDIYSKKEDISSPTQVELTEFMQKHGWIITRVIVQDPIQSKEVEEASNRVYAARRALEASEVEKKVIYNESVGAAEADAASLKFRTEASIKSRKLIADDFIEMTTRMASEGMSEDKIQKAIGMIEMIERKDMLTTVAKHGSLVVADMAGSDVSSLINAGLSDRMSK